MHRYVPFSVFFVSCVFFRPPESPASDAVRFTGAKSCATSGCHGGGSGNDQTITWLKRDVHSRSHAVLASGRSKAIADRLNIPDATKSARCTVCHAPLLSVEPDRFVRDVKPEVGVACESCHGPAERYLLSHTRPDYTAAMRQAAGLRNLESFYARSNACIACHQNIDPALLEAGHPEMFFELDSQMAGEPPHWVDKGTWLGPRAWLTGQAAALREISWALTNKPGDPALQPRFDALVWVLGKTDSGSRELSAGAAPGVTQASADRLARSASSEDWNQASTTALLRKLAALGPDFRDAPPGQIDLVRRRGEVVAIAVNRLWAALKQEAKLSSENLDTSVDTVSTLGGTQGAFDPVKFAAALEQVEVNLELLGKP